MLEKVKGKLRVKSSDAGIIEEITDLILEAKADLILHGVSETKVNDTDPEIISAVKLYAQANFGPSNPDSEKYMAAYEKKRDNLCMTAEYTEV